MAQKDLKQQLKLYPTVISLVGKDSLRREEACALILEVFVPDKDLRDFNVDSVTGGLTPEARTTLAEDPVGSEFRLVWLTSDQPEPFLKAKPPSTVLVALGTPFKSSQLEVDCKRLFGSALKHWIRSESKRAGVQLDKPDIETLAAESGGSLRKLRDDILKLALFGGGLSTETILHAAHNTLTNSAWDILRHIFAGEPVKAAEALQRVRGTGVPPVVVIGALTKELLSINRFFRGLSTSLSDFEKERYEKIKSRLSQKLLDESLNDVLDAEERVKRGEFGLFEVRLVSRLCKRLG